MLTIQDIGNEAVYKAALQEVKKTLPFGKKIFKNKFTREEAREVRKLVICKTDLQNLDFLQFFPNLQDLRMEYVVGLRDISGLQNCSNLKEFEASHSEIESLNDIAYCRSLTYFGYYLEEESKKYGKSDFSFLKNLPELEVICITGNKMEDTSVLGNLHKVRHLVLEDNPIRSIAPLKDMRSLVQLELEFCGLSSLDDLGEFKALKIVYAEGNLFTEEQKQEYQERYPDIEIDFEN